MNIKTPPCYDTSHWRTVPDFALVSPRPLLVLTKATEALTFVDDTFVRYFADLKQDGIHRGAYHFHRKSLSPLEQARHFCDTVAPHLLPKDILVLDVEEGGESAAQLMTFCQYVESRFPNHLFMIYSRKNILDPIPMTPAQKDYFKRIKIWTAGYPTYPDIYSTVPSFYIPDQTKWGEVWLWQYTKTGQIAGIVEEDTDCNWMSPALIAFLGATPPADTITTPRAGMQRVSGTRYGWNFELFISDPAKVDFESVCLSPLETVSSVVARKGATLGVNGGEWDRVSSVKDYTVSNGNVCKQRVESVPSLLISDNVVHIDHGYWGGVVQALSGLRYLIRNGIIQSYLSGTEPQYTEGHARSVHGVNAQGHHMVMQSRGVYPNQGLTLKQAAEIMKQYGAVTAFDSGGGGDVTCIFDGESLIVPENVLNGLYFERPLPNVFLIYAEESTMTTRYEAIATSDGTRLRPDHNTNNQYLSLHPAGTKFHGDVLFTATVNTSYQYIGDVWLQVTDINGAPASGWVAIKDKGIPICTLIDNGAPPPPTGNKPIEITATLDGYKPKTFSGELEPE